MNQSNIDWCDMVWNPSRGCTKVSAGCKFCYAERLHHRTSKLPFTQIEMRWAKIAEPLTLRKRKRIFVNSMSDIFHDDVSDDFIYAVFNTMLEANWHQYIVLTKRAYRMASILKSMSRNGPLPSHIAIGVSIENQESADERIKFLLDSPANTRILSVEPLIGEINELTWVEHLDWVIVGGESGPRARPMNPHWARHLRDACLFSRVPFFFKQWGEWGPRNFFNRIDSFTFDTVVGKQTVWKEGKNQNGFILDGKEYRNFPASWGKNITQA